jgi:hypothetical protein
MCTVLLFSSSDLAMTLIRIKWFVLCCKTVFYLLLVDVNYLFVTYKLWFLLFNKRGDLSHNFVNPFFEYFLHVRTIKLAFKSDIEPSFKTRQNLLDDLLDIRFTGHLLVNKFLSITVKLVKKILHWTNVLVLFQNTNRQVLCIEPQFC